MNLNALSIKCSIKSSKKYVMEIIDNGDASSMIFVHIKSTKEVFIYKI